MKLTSTLLLAAPPTETPRTPQTELQGGPPPPLDLQPGPQSPAVQLPETLQQFLRNSHIWGGDVWPRRGGGYTRQQGTSLLSTQAACLGHSGAPPCKPGLDGGASGEWNLPPPPAALRARLRQTRLRNRRRLRRCLELLRADLEELRFWVTVGLL
ncbi:E4 [Equus caballus papillomavirus 4]|uniref:E4 n=1 Tax=Equus caballus papillomavirus 4 TaxID=1235428 RepID=K9M9S8_9PAPI|nr:E4 [Equus caballus papillomavirus 4]AFS89106.1 E4 [Equus caballus papillomavirus 4]